MRPKPVQRPGHLKALMAHGVRGPQAPAVVRSINVSTQNSVWVHPVQSSTGRNLSSYFMGRTNQGPCSRSVSIKGTSKNW